MSDLSDFLRPRARASRWLWLLIAAMAASSAGLGTAACRSRAGLQHLRTRIGQLEVQQAALLVAKPSRQDAELQKRWSALRAEIDFPWQDVFQSLERADSKSIELLEFQPDKRNRTLALRGEARDEGVLIAYLESLAMQTAFVNVHLLHEETAKHDRLQTVAFEIKLTLAI